MKKFALHLFSILLIASTFVGCTEDEVPSFGTIYGIVTDAVTHQPIYGAKVTLSPNNTQTVTGYDGHYEFVDLSPGQYKVAVSADGYQTNTSQLQVYAGGKIIGDMTLTPEKQSDAITLSSTVLDFSTNYSELTLTLRNTGNVGNVSWYISGINVSWLSVAPQQGETAMGKSSEIKVIVDRSKITESTSTYFIVNAAGGSQSVNVIVSTNNNGGGNSGGGNNNGGGDDPVEEDYSSATVYTCDSRISTGIVSCKRTGTTVTFTYMILNNSFGDVEFFRIIPPSSMSLPNGTMKSIVMDNTGTLYYYPTMTFGNQTSNGVDVLSSPLYEDVPYKCTIVMRDVPEEATTITAKVGVMAYMHKNQLEDNKFTYKDVPIY